MVTELAAAEPTLVEKLAVPVLGAAAMIAVAVITLIGTFRTSGRAAQVQRDNELDARADRQNERLTDEVQRLTQLLETREHERDAARDALLDYRERYAALRVRVRNAGFDPDTIGQ